MQENREILALFHLIDDPDQEVFDSVSNRIVSYGRGIIPNLENLWENTISGDIQERIELLIHKLHYHDLTEDFTHWKSSSYQDLLTASLLVAKFQYPELVTTPVLQEVEKLRRNIWLELNSYLTPLEQVHVVTSILYNYYGLKGTEVAYQHPEEFMINKLGRDQTGQLHYQRYPLPPAQRTAGYPGKGYQYPPPVCSRLYQTLLRREPRKAQPDAADRVLYRPDQRQVFSHKDVESYFKRISVPPVASYFKPLSHHRIIQTALEEFSKCFDDERNAYKRKELLDLAKLLNE